MTIDSSLDQVEVLASDILKGKVRGEGDSKYFRII